MPEIRQNFRHSRRNRRQQRTRAACLCPWAVPGRACKEKPRSSGGLVRTSAFLWRVRRTWGKAEPRRQKRVLQIYCRRPCRQNHTWAWFYSSLVAVMKPLRPHAATNCALCLRRYLACCGHIRVLQGAAGGSAFVGNLGACPHALCAYISIYAVKARAVFCRPAAAQQPVVTTVLTGRSPFGGTYEKNSCACWRLC